MKKNKKEILNGDKALVTSSIISFETFRQIGNYEQSNLKREHPTCFNVDVSIVKYKITIEPIEEPKEVYAERLNKLWEECDNSHHWNPLKAMAKNYGIELSMDNVGKNRKK